MVETIFGIMLLLGIFSLEVLIIIYIVVLIYDEIQDIRERKEKRNEDTD